MLNLKISCFILLGVLSLYVRNSDGHGMMLDPVGRSSRWRYDSSAPKNYDDSALYCGGFGTQWSTHGGKCGLCGDDYGITPPRPNEIGGLYGGTGVIVKAYENSYTANVNFKITANHRGYVYFELCNLDEFSQESEECFQQHHHLLLADGSDKYFVGTSTGSFDVVVVWPEGLNCQHCVLRWTYRAGNNWGVCEDGTGTLGCGPQEHFKSCADISITAPNA